MNLVILVEGQQTEPQIYKAWLNHRLPDLKRVSSVADMHSNNYVLISGGGYPSIYRRIDGLLRDIHNFPGRADMFWICLDSEDTTYESRYEEVLSRFEATSASVGVKQSNPSLDLAVLIQHCCIETWLLGHHKFIGDGTQSEKLLEFRRFYDVRHNDPELMDAHAGYVTRQSFHLSYLKAMFAERDQLYSKTNPGPALQGNYFDALRSRRERTGHLSSFGNLIAAFDAAGARRTG